MDSLSNEALYNQLCSYDPRNPIYKDLLVVYDEEDSMPLPGQKGCGCDNCFYGRHPLANELLRLRAEQATAPATTGAAPPAPAATRLPRPCVVIHMSEDLIENVTVSEPIDVLTINYCDEDENHLQIPVDQGGNTTAQAYVNLHAIDIDPVYAVGRIVTYTNSNRQRC